MTDRLILTDVNALTTALELSGFRPLDDHRAEYMYRSADNLTDVLIYLNSASVPGITRVTRWTPGTLIEPQVRVWYADFSDGVPWTHILFAAVGVAERLDMVKAHVPN